MAPSLRTRLYALLRSLERYTKTDMVYLFSAGWWTNLAIIIASAFALVLSIALANLLTPTAYGVYQYLLSLSLLIAAISLAGMNNSVAQAAARGYEGVLKKAVRVQFVWMIVPTAVGFLGAGYYALEGNWEVAIGIAAIAVITPVANAFNTYTGYLEGKQAFRAGFELGTIVNVVSYASLFLAIAWVRDAAALVIINLGTNAAAMAWAYYRTLAKYKPNDRVDPAAVPYGKHLSVMTAFTTVMSQLDSILVFHFLGAADLAVYSLATLLPERAGTLFNFLGTASMPKFANQTLSYIQRSLFSKVGRVAIFGIILSGVYAIAAPFLFTWFFPKYLSAIAYSEGYAPIIALTAVTTVVTTVLRAKRFTREIYLLSIVQPVLLVGLQIPLLLEYGIWGMIVARLGTDLVAIVLTLWFTFRPLNPAALAG